MAEVNGTSAAAGEEGGGRRWGRMEVAVLALLVVAALGARLYLIPFHDVISADGTGYVGAARALAKGDPSRLASYGFYPVLIRLAGILGPDMETAGRLVSVVCGSLLVIPLYLLGTEFFRPRTTLAACAVTAFWPTLLGWSCEVMAQAPYILLVVTGTWCVWRMCRSASVGCGCAAGVCLGLAYLTRTEGSLLFLVLPLAALLSLRPRLHPLVRPLCGYGAAFALLLGANVLLVHHVTGTWQLAAKTSTALNDALSAYLDVADLTFLPQFQSTGYLDVLQRYPGFIWWNSARNLAITWHELVPLPLWLLAILGLLWGGRGEGRPAGRLFLLATFSPFLVIIVFYYVGPEYSQPYLPVLFLWCGGGMGLVERTLGRLVSRCTGDRQGRFSGRAPATLAAALVFAATLVARQVPAKSTGEYRPDDDGGRRDQKNIGLLLKQHLPPGKLMTRSGRIAYYADRDWQTIPKAPLGEILRTAREGKVRFLVVDGGQLSIRPELGPLLRPLARKVEEREFYLTPDWSVIAGLGVRPFLFYADVTSRGVAVYEVLP
jgi:hypothetical protein